MRDVQLAIQTSIMPPGEGSRLGKPHSWPERLLPRAVMGGTEMAEDLAPTIRDDAEGPAKTTGGAGSVEQHFTGRIQLFGAGVVGV